MSNKENLIINNQQVPIITQGQGDKLIIFLHGVPIPSSKFKDKSDPQKDFFKTHFKSFNDKYKVVAFDHSGLGNSKHRDLPVSIIIENILKKYDQENCSLMGASYGGAVAINIGYELKQKVSSIILAGLPDFENHYKFFNYLSIFPNPYQEIPQNILNSITNIFKVTQSLFFIYSTKDIVAPVSHGEKIYKDAISSEFKVMTEFGSRKHTWLLDELKTKYSKPLLDFLSQVEQKL